MSEQDGERQALILLLKQGFIAESGADGSHVVRMFIEQGIYPWDIATALDQKVREALAPNSLIHVDSMKPPRR